MNRRTIVYFLLIGLLAFAGGWWWLQRTPFGSINHVAINFYGQALDQDGKPVADALVSGGLRRNYGFSGESGRTVQTRTDDKGFFKFEGLKGESLGIRVTKTGYRQAMTKTHFIYSHFWPPEQRHVANANAPTIFRMWKLKGSEPLLPIGQRFRFTPSEGALRWDIIEGKRVDHGGDLLISVKRGAGVASQRNPVDWEATLQAIDGGLIETDFQTLDVTFEAPAEGYVPEHKREFRSGDRSWKDSFQSYFLMKSRGGKVYAKFGVYIRLDDNPGETVIVKLDRGVANPNSSRNWEPKE